MSQNLRVSAIVLRRTNYGEADRILTVLTRENGILSIIARGARKEKSRLASGIELFAICDFSLVKSAQNTGEIWTLTGAKMNKFFAQIMTDYDKLQFGYDAIKQVTKVSEQINAPEFYELLASTFAALDNTKVELKITKAWFYLQIARLLGNELNIMTDDHGMRLVEDAHYDFDTHEQIFAFNEAGKYDARMIKFLRILISNPPAVVAKFTDVDDLLDDCLWIAQAVAKV